MPTALRDVRFSNRPFGVKRFQTIHRYSVDVAHGLVLLSSEFGTPRPFYRVFFVKEFASLRHGGFGRADRPVRRSIASVG